MFSQVLLLLFGLLPLALAHFSVEYPYWRGDSFADDASQWIWPCANISQSTSSTNRTLWPLTGGSILLHVHHPSALTYINLGLGNNVTGFNVSLVAGFNQTGNGTFCLPSLGAFGEAQLKELGVQEGTNASLQVVQVGDEGNALYNCADITFSAQAMVLGQDHCVNSTGVGGVAIENAGAGTGNGESSGTASGSAASATSSEGAAAAAGMMVSGTWIGAVAMGFGIVMDL